MALPEIVKSHVKQDNNPPIYVLDRGLQSTRNMKEFEKRSITFIVRAKENRKHIELESFVTEFSNKDLGDLTLLKNCKVYLQQVFLKQLRKA